MYSHFTRVPGSFCLPPAQAISLHPKQDGLLRVTGGRVWATTNAQSGDHVLESGQTMHFAKGDHVVLEAWGSLANEPAYFQWME